MGAHQKNISKRVKSNLNLYRNISSGRWLNIPMSTK